ncbi:MAG: SHOCT domain-containing protein [Caldilinea sp.]
MRRSRGGRPSLIGTMARTAVVAGTATAVVGAVGSSQQQAAQQKAAAQQAQAAAQQAQIDDAVQQAVAQQAPPSLPVEPAQPVAASADPGTSTEDKIAQLKELGNLHQAGILSDEEFATMKAKILQ